MNGLNTIEAVMWGDEGVSAVLVRLIIARGKTCLLPASRIFPNDTDMNINQTKSKIDHGAWGIKY